MLEVLGIIYLSNYTAKCAENRGRKPGGFRALTVALWLGLELLFIFTGFLLFKDSFYSAYLLGILGAGLGALISVIVAKNCTPGDYVALHASALPGAEAMAVPCTLAVCRKSAFTGSAVAYTVVLNGQPVGNLRNGQKQNTLQTWTYLAQNVIVLRDVYGKEHQPLYFAVPPGGMAMLVCKNNRFLPELCTGVQILDPAWVQQVVNTYFQPATAMPQYPAQQYPQQPLVQQYPAAAQAYPQQQYPQQAAVPPTGTPAELQNPTQ